jgi:hypothetical protein
MLTRIGLFVKLTVTHVCEVDLSRWMLAQEDTACTPTEIANKTPTMVASNGMQVQL